ncbi:copper resistance protein CopB, partial [Pseudomonas aeruginosa]
DGSALAWDASGWIGGDINRLWLRSEGERLDGKTEDAEVQALFGHAIGPWWDLVAGVRQDFKPGSPQTW